MKKLLISIFTIASCMLFVSNSHALVDDQTCTVTNSDDNASSASFGSLRRKLNQGFNRPSNRFCMSEINFTAGKVFEIQLTSTMYIVGDGNLNITKKDATSVTIDGMGLGDDDCVLNLKDDAQIQHSHLTLTNITIKAKKREKAICGTITGTVPNIVAGDDQCHPGDACCTGNGRYADAGSSCDNNAGTCNGKSITCTPKPVQACTPNSECCDGSGNWKPETTACTTKDAKDGTCDALHKCNITPVKACTAANGPCCDTTTHTWKADGATCDDGNASTNNDKCTAHVCAGTPVAAACAAADGPCCDTTTYTWKADGATCDDGSASTHNDVCTAHHCAGTPAPGPGGGTVTPPGGSTTTPPGGSATPDTSNTTPIDLGGSGGGCILIGSLNSMAPFWMMILGMVPMVMIRRKKQF